MAVSLSYGAAGASLVVSDNGGEAWSTVQAKGLPAGKVFTSLACPTASGECWVSGNTPLHLADGRMTVGDSGGGAVLSSADGGHTWLSTGLPKGIAGIGPLSCPDPSTCFAMAFKARSTPSSGAVSYTHLDVYKRQGPGSPPRGISGARNSGRRSGGRCPPPSSRPIAAHEAVAVAGLGALRRDAQLDVAGW